MRSNINRKIKSIVFTTIALLISFVINAQTTVPFSSSGTWPCPQGVTSVDVECWGAGGAGGGNTTGNDGGGGAGGGAYSKQISIPVSYPNIYTVTVGEGGVSVSGGVGGTGGDSWFLNTSTVLAKGGTGGIPPGSGGAGGTGGQASAGIGGIKYSGGNGGAGNTSNQGYGGGGGSSAGTGADGNIGANAGATPGTGGAAVTGGGVGGDGGRKNVDATAGGLPGAGGGGSGEATSNAGAGANGQVIVSYTVTTPTITLNSAALNVCKGNTSVDLSYSATTNNPNQYSIDYDVTAQGQGFSDVSLDPLPASPISLVVPSGAAEGFYNADFTVTISGGATSIIYPITISVDQPAAATLSSNSPICSGDDAIFTISGTAGDQVTYTGGASGIATIGGGGTVDVTILGVTVNTTLNLTLVDDGTCTRTLTGVSETVTVDPLPNAATLSSNTPVCSGNDAIFTISGTAGDIVTYTGDASGTAIIGGGGTVGVTITGVTANTTLNLTLVDDGTCTRTLTGVSETVTLDPPAPVQPGPISGPATVSASTGGLVYNITAVANADANGYVWTIPSGWSGTSTSNSITLTSGTAGGSITVTASNSCGTSPSQTLTVSIGVPPDCPTSTSVTSGGLQSGCPGFGVGTLTATNTSSGGSGTYTPIYQWYYNATNSNTIAGATSIGANSSTFTPPVTVSEQGNRYYFCVAYATDNTCGQSATDQSLASNTVLITVDPPAPVQPGAITGPTTVSPSASGLVYSISAVPNATTYNWVVPTGWTINSGSGTTSITVTSGAIGQNGNITVTASNSCGTSAASALAVTVAVAAQPPTITLGSNPTVCTGTTTANLSYSATTESPNQYSIDYYAASEAQGFVDVTNAALPASPISLVVPGGAATGIYYGSLSVKNSTSGLSSGNYTISVEIISTPAKPGTILGQTTVPELTTGLSYAILPVTYATTYTWTVPSGWAITGGQGTNGIIVTSGLAGQNGNITVTAGNSCGTSAAATLAVVSQIPTNHSLFGCNACHVFHNSPGVTLTNTFGNALLCQTCHAAGGAAKLKPFSNADKAIPGTSGNSHAWDVASVNPTYETVLTTDPQMVLRVDGGNIVCSTCHDQHNSNSNTSYTRISNVGDAMCKDCHSLRNKGRYSDNPLNTGSHPVGLDYTGTGDFEATPTGSVTLPGGKIECSSCHQTHFAPINDGLLLRQTNTNDALCTSCHTLSGHKGNGCSVCHQTHNTNKANIYMIKNTIQTLSSGIKTVNFTGLTGTNSFADGDATYDGICEVCHTGTSYFRNDGSAPDQNHSAQGGPMNGQNCITCHPHNTDFSPSGGSCHGCHDSSKPHLYPTTAGGYNEGSHAVHASKYVCSTCHFERGQGGPNEGPHPSSSKDVVFDPNGLATRYGNDANTPEWERTGSPANTCDDIYCHSDATASPTYTTTPSWNVLPGTGINTCTPCHGVDILSGISPGTAAHNTHVSTPYNYTCSTCHDGLDNTSSDHANGTKNVVFDPLSLAKNFNTQAAVPIFDTVAKTCNNIYCHSDGNNNFQSTPLPDWSGAVNCGDCHTDAPTTGAHTKHTGTPYSYSCTVCHTTAHVNGTVGVDFDPSGMATRNGADALLPTYIAPAYSAGTCTNVYCHSNGITAQSTGAGVWSIGAPTTDYATNKSYTSPVWTSTATGACGTCHGGNSTGTAWPTSRNSGDHGKGAHQEVCNWCHNVNGTSSIVGGTIGTQWHVDGDVWFDARTWTTGALGTGTMHPSNPNSYASTHCGDKKACWY